MNDLKEAGHGGCKCGELATWLTVAGEQNKLTSNISLGRNFVAVHRRSDQAESLRLGDEVAVQFLRQTVFAYNEQVSFSSDCFDGPRVALTNSEARPRALSAAYGGRRRPA